MKNLENLFDVLFFPITFAIVFVGFFGAIFGGIIAAFSVKIRSGEVVVLYRENSRSVEKIYVNPGRCWRFPAQNMSLLRLQVNEPVTITSRPVEVRTHEGASVTVTARLTLDVTNPARYATAVVEKKLEEWHEEILPVLIARVVSGYTVAQVLNDRGQVADRIAGAIVAWFARNVAPDLGLDFKRAAIVDATRPSVRRDYPRDAPQ